MFGKACATTVATDAGWGGVVFHMSEPVPCQHSSIIGRSPEKLGSCRLGVRRRRLRVSDIYSLPWLATTAGCILMVSKTRDDGTRTCTTRFWAARRPPDWRPAVVVMAAAPV